MSMHTVLFLAVLCTFTTFPVDGQVTSSTGATVTTPTGATVYAFLNSGSITFSGTTNVDVLIVGGGGPGGGSIGGGGGGGGFVYAIGVQVPAGTYSATVAAGGQQNPGQYGAPGGASSIFGMYA